MDHFQAGILLFIQLSKHPKERVYWTMIFLRSAAPLLQGVATVGRCLICQIFILDTIPASGSPTDITTFIISDFFT